MWNKPGFFKKPGFLLEKISVKGPGAGGHYVGMHKSDHVAILNRRVKIPYQV
jgi:hypothetical protein